MGRGERKERDVRVRLPDDPRCNPNLVADLPLARRGNQMVTIRQVATTTTEDRPTGINRVDRQRIALVGAEPCEAPLGAVLVGGMLASTVLSLLLVSVSYTSLR